MYFELFYVCSCSSICNVYIIGKVTAARYGEVLSKIVQCLAAYSLLLLHS